MSDEVEDGTVEDLELRIEHLEAQRDAFEERAKALQKMLDAKEQGPPKAAWLTIDELEVEIAMGWSDSVHGPYTRIHRIYAKQIANRIAAASKAKAERLAS